jgi:toxin ParE1/3/4
LSRRVYFRPRAERDIDEIAAYIAQDSLGAARRFLQETKATFATLSQFPGIGARWLAPGLPLMDLRSFPVRRHPAIQVYYTCDSEDVIVIRVLHSARNVERLLDQEAT